MKQRVYFLGSLPAWLAVMLIAGAACSSGAPAATSPSPASPASSAAPPPAATAPDPAPASAAANPYTPAAGAPLQNIRVGACAVTGGFVQLYTAIEGGVFPRYGLNVELVVIRGSAPALAAMSTNDIQFLYCAADATVAGLASGAEAKIVGAALVGTPYVLIARPEIRSFADLRGKALGIPRAGDLADQLSRAVLQRHGLVPNVDVDIRPVGGSQPERYQAMLADIVQANVLTPPLDAQARKDGLNVMYDLADLGLPFVYSSVHAGNGTIRDNPALVERFVAAMAESIAFTERNPEVARAALRKTLSVDDPAVLDSAYEAYARKLVNPRMQIPLDTINASIEDARAEGTTVVVRGAEDIATNTFVDAIARRGLFDYLYPAEGTAAPSR